MKEHAESVGDLISIPLRFSDRGGTLTGLPDEEEVGLLCDELMGRWRRGLGVPVESYLRRFPDLDPGSEQAFELIYTEYFVRRELGDSCLDEFLARFPRQAERLRRQVALGEVFEEDVPDNLLGTNREGGKPDVRSWPTPEGYEVERLLGRGGMGVVYQARRIQLNRRVALKMIRAGTRSTSEAVERVLAEAEVIARFQHPNIVQVYHVGECDGQPFFEMEYVGGGNLATRLNAIPQPAREAAPLLAVVARGIHEAHGHGIVHRDLKPANILLTPSGIPKIADFGLAKLVGGDSRLTQTDSVLGSPGYMAPEQTLGGTGDVGPAADVYALGVIFYEMLTGHPPFTAPTVLETLDLVRNAEPVPPSRLQPGLPRDAETICLRCLAKEPSRRYESAAALADDLERFVRREPIRARPVSAAERGYRWARRNPLVAGLLTAVAVLVVGGFAGMAMLSARARASAYRADRRAEEALQARRDYAAMRAEADGLSAGLTLDRGVELAKAGHAARGLHFFAKAVQLDPTDRGGGSGPRANLGAWTDQVPRIIKESVLSGPSYCAAFSPDGRTFVTGNDGGEVEIRATDSLRRVGPSVPHRGRVRHLVFSPDGRIVASSSEDHEVRLRDPSTGATLGPPLVHPKTVGIMAFHPGGRLLATTSQTDLRFWEVSTGKLVAGPITCSDRIDGAAFSPDGSTLVLIPLSNKVERRDGLTGRLLGPPLTLPDACWAVSFQPDGKRFAVGYGSPKPRSDIPWPSGVQIFELDGRPSGPPLPHDQGVCQVRFRPDGRALIAGDYGGTVRFWTEAGRPMGEAWRGDGKVTSIAFSADGRAALISHALGTAELWDAFEGRRLGSSVELPGELYSAFRPDGGAIVAIGERAARMLDVSQVPRPARALHEAVRIVRFKPDGRALVTVGEDFTARIWGLHGRPIGMPMPHRWNIFALDISADGGLIATGSSDATVRLWRGADGAPLGPPILQTHWVLATKISPKRDILAVGRADNTTQLFRISDRRPLGPPISHPGTMGGAAVHSVEFVDEGRVVLSVSNTGTVGRLDAATGKPLGALQTYPTPFHEAKVSPDGKTLMIVAGGVVLLSDAVTGVPRREPFGRGAVSAAYLPDGRTIVVGGEDHVARTWDTVTGAPVGGPMEHEHILRSVTALPDGRRVLTVGVDGRLQGWDAVSAKPVGPCRRHDLRVPTPAISPDGHLIVSTNGPAWLWSMPGLERADPTSLRQHVEDLTRLSLDARWGFTPREARSPAGVEATASAWHDRAASEAEARHDDRAALRHLDDLARDRPDNWLTAARRARALRRVNEPDKAAAEEARMRRLSSREEAADWSGHLAIDEARLGHWEASLPAFDRALAARPDNDAMRYERGVARAHAGHWAGALADCQQATRDGSPWVLCYYQRAVMARMCDDDRVYREICEWVLKKDRGAGPSMRGTLALAVWVCVLGPHATADPERLLRVARSLDPRSGAELPITLIQGAALYRAGQYAEAIRCLDEAMPQLGPEWTFRISAFLAMANARLGNSREARRHGDRVLKEFAAPAPAADLWDLAEARFLKREVESVVYGPKLPGERKGDGAEYHEDS